MKRQVLIGVALALITSVIGYALIDYHRYTSGYCYDESRYISSDEVYKNALVSIHRQLSNEYTTFGADVKSQVIYYHDPKDIKTNNPNCCNGDLEAFWGVDGYQRKLSQELKGYYSGGAVYLDLDKVPKVDFQPRADFTVNSCGVVRDIRIYNSEYYSKKGISNAN